MEGGEEALVIGFQDAEALGSVVGLGEEAPAGGEGHRGALEANVLGKPFGPAFDLGVKVLAVHAAVGEELHHRDGPPGRPFRCPQVRVVLPGLRRPQGGEEGVEAGPHDKEGGEAEAPGETLLKPGDGLGG